MTSRITAVGGKPLPHKTKESICRKEKAIAELALLENKSNVTEKRAEAQNKNSLRPSEAWSMLPGGKRWMGFGN